MNRFALDKNEIHKNLSNTSVALTYKFWGLKRSQVTKRPEDGSLSPLEILIVMRQMAEIYTARVERLVNSEQKESFPKLHDYDEEKLLKKIDLEDETPKSNINIFLAARSDMLNMISFDDDLWENCKCVHEQHGKLSLRELLSDLVERERELLERLEILLPE